MNIKKVIDFWFKLPNRITFKCLSDSFINEYDDNFKITKKALEKQMPMKLNELSMKIGPYKSYKCVCGHLVLECEPYCNHCGQKLDWKMENYAGENILQKLKKENNKLKEKLQISPYGDDKVDVLEDALEHCKFKLESKAKQNNELKLMLGIILESHKKGYSSLTLPIVNKVKELLK